MNAEPGLERAALPLNVTLLFAFNGALSLDLYLFGLTPF